VNEKQALEITAKAMTDNRPVGCEVSVKEAWIIASSLMFVVKNANVGKMFKDWMVQTSKKFEAAVVALHPDAKAVLSMGWDSAYDHIEYAPTSSGLKSICNVWAIYTEGLEDDEPALAEFSRPQDWGDPKYMYRVYTIEALGYRNEVHCWLDKKVQEHEHLQMFAGLLTQILTPGQRREICANTHLREDDFWRESWGEMPPHFEEDDYEYYGE
jgi:hypothetical protein